MEKEKTRNFSVSRRTFLKGSAVLLAKVFMPISIIDEQPAFLETYLAEIEPERAYTEQIFTESDPLKDFIRLNSDQRLEDFNIYHPLYKAAEVAYQIPWYLLMVIHAHETTFSRSTNPERNGYLGAMQIHPMHTRELKDAALGWEFLDDLDQRYLKRQGYRTNDWEEILRAGLFIRNRANQKRFYSDEEKILNIVTYNYSATVHGLARVRQYRYIKSLLEK